MTFEEACLIAQRMEDDNVCGPVGLALRIIYKEYQGLMEVADGNIFIVDLGDENIRSKYGDD